MNQRLFAIITTYDEQATDVLAAMGDTLPEAYVDLFNHSFDGIIAQIDYGKIEVLQREGGFWQEVSALELGLYAENLDYNIFSLSKKVAGKTFIYLDLRFENETWLGEGFSIYNEKILFRINPKNVGDWTALVHQIYPDFKQEFFETWVKHIFETRGKAWWEYNTQSFQP